MARKGLRTCERQKKDLVLPGPAVSKLGSRGPMQSGTRNVFFHLKMRLFFYEMHLSLRLRGTRFARFIKMKIENGN